MLAKVSDHRLAYFLAILPPLFWSGNFLIARVMRDEIPPIQMSFWRWTVAFWQHRAPGCRTWAYYW